MSNFTCHSSGHWYFTLKDDAAQIRCAMFRGQNYATPFFPTDGLHVIARAKVSLYTQRGEYQLIVSQMEEAGLGVLQKRFEQLKEQLAEEGLFNPEHKKTLPTYPKTIGIITSPTGAALQDVLTVLKRRYPIAEIVVYPSFVQGADAAQNIVDMLNYANEQKKCSVLLLTRGGGSLEDLWSFNEENVARAIYASTLPIMTGIGHEIDVTIADFVADVRAPTPSAAAEMLTPDQYKIQQYLSQQEKFIRQSCYMVLHRYQQHLTQLSQRLYKNDPRKMLLAQKERLKQCEQKLLLIMKHYLSQHKHQLMSLGKQLHQLSPLNTLDRGYAIVFDQESIVTSINNITIGQTVITRLKDGILESHVTAKKDNT
ncbi:MAG: exodeoxyribonuclease VII large subunit [Gammaproteobacteria bacterium]|nr:exodeoxyribonuclease VII large subunit [Gammaproteobacteria bacterium]